MKKNITFLHENFLNRLTFKLSIAYFVFVLATAGASLTFHLSMKFSIDSVNRGIQSGKIVVDDFANGQVLMVLVKEFHYNRTQYENYLYPNLNTYISELLVNM